MLLPATVSGGRILVCCRNRLWRPLVITSRRSSASGPQCAAGCQGTYTLPVNGLTLARRFHEEVLAPLLDRHAPGLVYAAARIGSGSDVLGLDDERSQDHDWGCRLQLFVRETGDLDALLERELPEHFLEHPVRFATTWDPHVRQRVEVVTIAGFVESRLGVDATRELTAAEWLCLTGQSVLEVVGGEVFADAAGELVRVRERLRWYPDDVWRYVIAAAWRRFAEELPLVGRSADRGDELGSRIIATRLVRDIIHLAFMLERTWPPYPKWLGTRFRGLQTYAALAPGLDRALSASDWRRREDALVESIEVVHARQEAIGLPAPSPAVEPFFDRPYRIASSAIAEAVHSSIAAHEVRALPAGIGSIEQWVDNVAVLAVPERRCVLAQLLTTPRQLLSTSRS